MIVPMKRVTLVAHKADEEALLSALQATNAVQLIEGGAEQPESVILEKAESRVQRLKDATPAGVLLGSGKLATELDRLDLIDEYRFLVHPRIVGHGPALYGSGLPGTRRLELVAAQPMRCGAVAVHYRRAP